MNRNQALVAAMLGLSVVGAVSLPGAIASAQDSPPYNCTTREVWSPEKQAWCAEQMQNVASEGESATSIEDWVGTEWQLTRFNGGPVLEGVQTTLVIESSDRLVGNGGCNNYFASMMVEGDTLSVGTIGSTFMACEPEIMEQESQFLAALQNATRFALRGDTLRVYSDGLQKPLKFALSPTTAGVAADEIVMIEPLIGTQWQLAELNGRPVSDAIQTTLTIESSERIMGKGGCNGYFAPIQVDGDRITLEPIGATMAMCEPDVMDQESQFFQVLQAATQFEYDGTSLLIYSDASDQPLRFTQIESTVSSTADMSALVEGLVGTQWLLEDLNGSGVIDNAQSTLVFVEQGESSSETRIGGSGGCNRYFSQLTAEAERISISAIGSTRMACAPALMDQESRFFQALQTANRIELDGPYLRIYSDGIEQPLRFTRIASTVGG